MAQRSTRESHGCANQNRDPHGRGLPRRQVQIGLIAVMDEQRDKPENLVSQMATEAAASGGGILTQLAMGSGVVTTVAGGAAPVVISTLVRVTREVIRRRQNRVGKVLNAAAEAVGGLDIFEERLYSHDERVELLGQVLEAAARTTTLEDKVRALSHVLVYGLKDDADMGEAFILTAALADIEAPHLEVLRYIHVQPLPPPELQPHQDIEPQGWESDYLARALPEVAEIIDGLVAVLVRHGLLKEMGGVTYPGSVGPAMLTISRLGRRVIFLLSHEADRLSSQAKATTDPAL